MSTLLAELAETADAAGRQRAAASRMLRNAVGRAARSGLSQRTIGRAMQRSQPEIRRLLAHSASHDAAGRPRRWMTARSTAAAISERTAQSDDAGALRMLLQGLHHLEQLTDTEDIEEWAVEPAPLADARFDTLLRALAAQTMARLGHEIPHWTQLTTPLSQEWVIPRTPSQRARARRETPAGLAELNIFLTEQDLMTL